MNHSSRFLHRHIALPALFMVMGPALAGCNDDGEQTASTPAATQSSVTTPVQPDSPPAAGPPPTGASTNRAPAISGTPGASLNAGSNYSFTPASSDADGDTLMFAISNKPSWAVFNTTTGQLSGTPAAGNVGTFAGIAITVSDGKTTRALNAFSITVTQVATGNATLSWMPPLQNTDGSQLLNLTGYRVYFGTSASAMTQTIELTNASLSTYVVGNLSPGTWYFTITAIANGMESDRSSVASKTIS